MRPPYRTWNTQDLVRRYCELFANTDESDRISRELREIYQLCLARRICAYCGAVLADEASQHDCKQKAN